MKRAKQLQPLSRQHHLGLNLSRHAKECIDEPEAINQHWQNLTDYLKEMENHFRIEDNLIATALQPYRASKPEVASVLNTLDEQHKALHALMDAGQHSPSSQSKHVTVTGTVNEVRQLGTLLYDHIRFEERELFPIIECYLTEQDLDAIYAASPDSIKRSDEDR